MTQEIKQRLEQSASNDTGGYYKQQAFIRGAQTILENPHGWGLADMDEITQAHLRYFKSVRKATKYREALERIIVEAEDNEKVDWRYIAENMVEIAEKALKQQ